MLNSGSINELRQRTDSGGDLWFEMVTDIGGYVEYHYGKRLQRIGYSSLECLTPEQLEQWGKSHVLDFNVFCLMQWVLSKFKGNLTEEQMKSFRTMLGAELPISIDLNAVGEMWFELITMDGENEMEFHYGRPQETLGTSSSIRLTLKELEELEESCVPVLGAFFMMQVALAKLTWHEPEDGIYLSATAVIELITPLLGLPITDTVDGEPVIEEPNLEEQISNLHITDSPNEGTREEEPSEEVLHFDLTVPKLRLKGTQHEMMQDDGSEKDEMSPLSDSHDVANFQEIANDVRVWKAKMTPRDHSDSSCSEKGSVDGNASDSDSVFSEK